MKTRPWTCRFALVATGLALVTGAGAAHAQSAPLQDTQIFTAPAGVASAFGGPTPRGEISIVRERSFATTPPSMTGSGLVLVPADPARDGRFSESIYVRTGPVVSNTRDPEAEFTLVFPAGVTVIGVVFADATLAATHATWGLQPTVDYTSSATGVEAPGTDTLTVTAGGGGTTVVRVRTNMNNSPFTDDFRVLIDYGASFTAGVVMRVNVTTGDDVNVGGTNGGRSGSPTGYTVDVPLTLSCTADMDADRVPDCLDGTNDTDGDGRPNYLDPDDDGDGVPTTVELGTSAMMPRNTDAVVPAGEGTADTVPDWLDADDDGDGVPTSVELGPGGATMPRNTDAMPPAGAGTADAIADYLDRDDDGDGIPTATENALDATMGDDFDSDGAPSYRDWDSDADGLFDRAEGTRDGNMNMRPDFLDPSDDSDGDGVPNSVERGGCTGTVPGCVMGDRDTDRDGTPDFLDPDDDGDGIPTATERSLDPTTGDDFDMDGVPSYRDTDSDGDGDLDRDEAGATPTMPANTDRASDGPDFLDRDSDNDCAADSLGSEDGVARVTVSTTPNSFCTVVAPVCDTTRGVCVPDSDNDMDGIPNLFEIRNGTNPNNRDSDMDGVPDGAETGAGPMFVPRDTDRDGRIDALDDDDDGDTILTRDELGASGFMMPLDTDGDRAFDYLDTDDDDDGILTADEARLDTTAGDDFDGDGTPSYRDTDSDDDRLLDRAEGTRDTNMNMRPDFLDPSDDNDGDGVPNSVERGGCTGSMPGCVMGDRDTDRDGTPDFLDPDDDGDGIPTATERLLDPTTGDDFDMDGTPSYRDTDSDGDGDLDRDEAGATPTMPANTDRGSDGPDFLDTDSDNDCAADSVASEDGVARVTVAMSPSANCMEPAAVCDTSAGRCVACLVTGMGAGTGCASNPNGTRCLAGPSTDRNACGCATAGDCAMDRACNTAINRCEPRSTPDAGADASEPDASTDGGVTVDSGVASDSGAMDGAVSTDSGVIADSGLSDGGSMDAVVRDAGDASADGAAPFGVLSGDGACGCRVVSRPARGAGGSRGALWAIAALGAVSLARSRKRCAR
ncbi:MAG: hypothetical protein JNK05_06070 [Myxococcales bacterium]|nr:hypothetical protein [Myxococcales bacterium]